MLTLYQFQCSNIVQPILDRIAGVCLRVGISANALTVLGMLVDVCAALLVAAGHAVAGVAVLWLCPATPT